MCMSVPDPIHELEEIPDPEELGYKVLDDPYVDITGFEYVRNDSSELTGMLQKAIFDVILHYPMTEDEAWHEINSQFNEFTDEAKELILHGLTREAGKDDVVSIIEQIQIDTEDGKYPVIMACRGPSVKAVEDIHEEYKQPPIAAKCGHFTNKFFNSVNIQAGDDVYYVYTKMTGYNHQGRKLPENTNAIGMVEGMEPPMAKVTCIQCGNEWEVNEFGLRIQREGECPECGHSYEETVGDDDPFDVDGCFADWEKIANKSVKKKARKVLKHLGWEGELDTIGDQDTFGAF